MSQSNTQTVKNGKNTISLLPPITKHDDYHAYRLFTGLRSAKISAGIWGYLDSNKIGKSSFNCPFGTYTANFMLKAIWDATHDNYFLNIIKHMDE